MTRQTRLKLWVFLVASVGVAAFIGWVINNGHPWLGIAAIIVFFIAQLHDDRSFSQTIKTAR